MIGLILMIGVSKKGEMREKGWKTYMEDMECLHKEDSKKLR